MFRFKLEILCLKNKSFGFQPLNDRLSTSPFTRQTTLFFSERDGDLINPSVSGADKQFVTGPACAYRRITQYTGSRPQ